MWMTIQSNTTHNNVCTWRNGLFLEWENEILSSTHSSEILDSKKPVDFNKNFYYRNICVTAKCFHIFSDFLQRKR